MGAVLAACATSTPYQPIGAGDAGKGYYETELEPGRWTATFMGNSVTDPDTVETYLLYRCAELTLAHGYDWFRTVGRHAALKAESYGPAPETRPTVAPPSAAWGPSWRYRAREGWIGGWTWHSWDPREADASSKARTATGYAASAEIVMGRGPKPQDGGETFDAREVVDALRPTVIRR